jgi:hypothetical protein
MYSSYSFTTSTLDGGEWSASSQARISFGKGSPVPIVQEAGWAPEPVWTRKNLLPLPGSNLDRPVRSQTPYCLSYPETWGKPHAAAYEGIYKLLHEAIR